MSAHLTLLNVHKANLFYQLNDPGNAGTIGTTKGIERSPAYVNLVSAGAETRTLPRPTAAGDIMIIGAQTIAGTITLTVTGGYDTAGDTTLLITAAGQVFQFISIFTGGAFVWRLVSSTNGTGGNSLNRAMVITNLSTVGAGTITAAGVVGGVTNRTGPTAAFTDTTDTAALIIAAMPAGTQVGASWKWTYYNNSLGTGTLVGGSGVTVTGSGLAANQWAEYLVTFASATTITMVQIETGPNAALPYSKVTTGTAATFNAGDITGAAFVNYINNASNATITVRTAAQMFADIPNCQIGFSYQLAIRNLNATGATITADGGATVTLSGTMSIAQNVTRMFNVTFPTVATCTITSMGISAAAA